MRLAVWLIERPRWFKRTFLIVNDLFLLSFAIWGAYALRLSRFYIPPTWDKWLLLAAAPVIGVFVFYMRGLYKLVTRFIGPEGTARIYIAVIIAAVLVTVVQRFIGGERRITDPSGRRSTDTAGGYPCMCASRPAFMH